MNKWQPEIKWPKPPSGIGSEAAWMRQLLDGVRRLDDAVRRFQVNDIGTGGVSSFNIQIGIVTTLQQNNHVGVKVFNAYNGTVIGAEIQVAKCVTGQLVPMETIDGNVVSYTYGDNISGGNKDNIRLATGVGLTDEWQVMHPRYTAYDGASFVGSIILFAPISVKATLYDDPVRTQYIEIQPTRYWAYQNSQQGFL